MIKLIWLLGLATLLTACSESRKDGPSTAYDPCRQMKEDAKNVRDLENQVKALVAESEAVSTQAGSDTVAQVTLDSLIVQKEDILASAVQNMQESAEDCEARSRPFDRYRTPPEREEGL